MNVTNLYSNQLSMRVPVFLHNVFVIYHFVQINR